MVNSIVPSILIIVSMFESNFPLLKYQNKELSLVSDSYPSKNLHNLVMVARHSIYTSSNCGKFDNEDSWFLEPYQKNPGQASTLVAHIREGVEIAAQDEGALLLFSGGETRKGAGPRSEAQSYWPLRKQEGGLNGLAGLYKGGTSEYKIAGRSGSVVVEAELDAGNLSEPRRHMRPHVCHPLGDQRDTPPCSTLNGCNPATCQISDYRGLVRRKPY